MSSILKQELLNKIAATNDEGLLQYLKEEIDYFTEGKTTLLDKLSPEDFLELKALLKEPFGHETESYDDFKKATQR